MSFGAKLIEKMNLMAFGDFTIADKGLWTCTISNLTSTLEDPW